MTRLDRYGQRAHSEKCARLNESVPRACLFFFFCVYVVSSRRPVVCRPVAAENAEGVCAVPTNERAARGARYVTKWRVRLRRRASQQANGSRSSAVHRVSVYRVAIVRRPAGRAVKLLSLNRTRSPRGYW